MDIFMQTNTIHLRENMFLKEDLRHIFLNNYGGNTSNIKLNTNWKNYQKLFLSHIGDFNVLKLFRLFNTCAPIVEWYGSLL